MKEGANVQFLLLKLDCLFSTNLSKNKITVMLIVEIKTCNFLLMRRRRGDVRSDAGVHVHDILSWGNVSKFYNFL